MWLNLRGLGFTYYTKLVGEKMKEFRLEFEELTGWFVGKRAAGKNEHGYEYSVVCHNGSYGGTKGQYEFAGYDSNGEMVHHSVTGWLSLLAATEMAKNWKG